MIAVSAYSDRHAAIASAERLAATHASLRIAVVYEPRKEPWPFRVIALAQGAEVEWPDGVTEVDAVPAQLTLDVNARRAS